MNSSVFQDIAISSSPAVFKDKEEELPAKPPLLRVASDEQPSWAQ